MFKIIPIEGQVRINGEEQKKADDVLAEALIAEKLSALRQTGLQAMNGVTMYVTFVMLSSPRIQYAYMCLLKHKMIVLVKAFSFLQRVDHSQDRHGRVALYSSSAQECAVASTVSLF